MTLLGLRRRAQEAKGISPFASDLLGKKCLTDMKHLHWPGSIRDAKPEIPLGGVFSRLPVGYSPHARRGGLRFCASTCIPTRAWQAQKKGRFMSAFIS
jgi:hypothetical protein